MHWSRVLKWETLVLLAVVGLGGLVALTPGSTEADYSVLDADLEPFRSNFNAASDQVRAVLLVGPT